VGWLLTGPYVGLVGFGLPLQRWPLIELAFWSDMRGRLARHADTTLDRVEEVMSYLPDQDRYSRIEYRRSGRSGIKLPEISLGLWQNFGHTRPLEVSREIVLRAFDMGITHFDLANNYGPPYGSAEETFGHIMAADLAPHRDELVISTKAVGTCGLVLMATAGHANTCSPASTRACSGWVSIMSTSSIRTASTPDTALEETMGALASAVRQGQGALRRHLLLFERPDQERRRDAAVHGHTATHPPALVQHAEPLDRGRRPARRARSRGGGLHRLLAARTGCAHREISQWHSDGSRATHSRYLSADQITQDTLAKVQALSAIAAQRGSPWRRWPGVDPA